MLVAFACGLGFAGEPFLRLGLGKFGLTGIALPFTDLFGCNIQPVCVLVDRVGLQNLQTGSAGSQRAGCVLLFRHGLRFGHLGGVHFGARFVECTACVVKAGLRAA